MVAPALIIDVQRATDDASRGEDCNNPDAAEIAAVKKFKVGVFFL